ncbi:hypothetical protein SAMN04489716_6176 [Actinoplanes derwentensis]|uniref:Uncharacterized protein n=1 Tax=Actinoplanes derwentensis TaxID=113562 RepID=A0A1H2CLU7_9ACTN|nr:hypothetical protein SAMN04489716_6176 [Actinoplanes derwentensis]
MKMGTGPELSQPLKKKLATQLLPPTHMEDLIIAEESFQELRRNGMR